MNFVFRLGFHPKLFHYLCIYSQITRKEKNQNHDSKNLEQGLPSYYMKDKGAHTLL